MFGFLDHTGYGQSLIDYILCIDNIKKYKIRTKCLNGKLNIKSISENKKTIIERLKLVQFDSEYVQIYQCIPTMQHRVQKNNKSIGFATFETYDPPNEWIDILNKNDAIICPSDFNFRIFANARY